jgi:hypothetical protein
MTSILKIQSGTWEDSWKEYLLKSEKKPQNTRNKCGPEISNSFHNTDPENDIQSQNGSWNYDHYVFPSYPIELVRLWQIFITEWTINASNWER